MHLPRYDVAPLPITELAPIRFDSGDRDEPFVLAGRVHGRCGLTLQALKTNGDFVPAADVAALAIITPCGVLRSARISGVQVHERVAVLLEPAAVVSQWTVDRDVVLDLGQHGQHPLSAGATLTIAPDIASGGIDRAFRATCAAVARAGQGALGIRGAGPLGNAFAWASARLALHADAVKELPGGLAALAAGRAHALRDALPDAPADLMPLLAARYAAATGDLNTVTALRSRLQPAADRLLDLPAADDATAVVRLAGLTELQRTATDLGDPAWAARLHALARRAATAIEAASDPALTRAMTAALRLAPPLSTAQTERNEPVSSDVASHAWCTWGALAIGSLRDGFAGLDRLLLESNRPVRGAWPSRFGALEDDATATALCVALVADGLLGIEPDAPRNRLRLAPRLAAHGGLMSVHGIRCGDAFVRINIKTEPDAVTVTVTQDDGAIPLTALLEPVVAAPVHSAHVDGRPAALDCRRFGEGTVAPVQLVLDDARTLRLQLGSG